MNYITILQFTDFLFYFKRFFFGLFLFACWFILLEVVVLYTLYIMIAFMLLELRYSFRN